MSSPRMDSSPSRSVFLFYCTKQQRVNQALFFFHWPSFRWIISIISLQDGAKIGETSMIEKIGEEKYQDLTNMIFKLMADIRLPVKRGTFIEFRKGMINCSPIGRACSQSERDAFEQFDKGAQVRPKMVEALKVRAKFCSWLRQMSAQEKPPFLQHRGCKLTTRPRALSLGTPFFLLCCLNELEPSNKQGVPVGSW